VAATAAFTVQEAATITTGAARLMDEAGAVTTGAARLVDEAGAVTAGAVRVLDGAGRATGAAEVLLADVTAATGAATAVVTQAEAAAAEAARLLAGYAPTLDKAAPLAARFVNDLTPDEVTSAIKMVDELPRLREHLVNDVMPLLGKLDQVGPDLHNLLAVTQDLHLAIVGLPGLKMLRRRGEERVAEDEDRSKRP
jgi:ABC-type transporter Mla subunit MlaD